MVLNTVYCQWGCHSNTFCTMICYRGQMTSRFKSKGQKSSFSEGSLIYMNKVVYKTIVAKINGNRSNLKIEFEGSNSKPTLTVVTDRHSTDAIGMTPLDCGQ